MCRLFAMTSETPVSPMIAMEAMDVMREGHDGSGVGLFLRDLGGPFEEIKNALKTDNAADIKSATEKLNATWQEVAQRMYQAVSEEAGAAGGDPGAGAQGAGPSEGGAGQSQAGPKGASEEVADAEYEVIDDDKQSKTG